MRRALPALPALLALLLLAAPAAAQETVRVEHADGVTEAPVDPQRVVVLGEEILELAVLLDMDVVGLAPGRIDASTLDPDGTLSDASLAGGIFEDAGLDDVAFVGTWIEPSIEAIIAARPDLIVRTWWGQDGYDLLSRIAPTVSLSQVEEDAWPRALRTLAAIEGEPEAAEEILADLDARFEELSAELEEAGVLERHPSAVVLSPFPGGEVYLYTGDRIADVLRDLGFEVVVPEGAEADPRGWAPISEEAILRIPEDALIVAAVYDGFEGKEPALDLMERTGARVVRYALPAASPWTGPVVDRLVAEAVADELLDR